MLQYRIALQSLRMNRVRTGLTTLGIIIGVASITLILSIGNGIENAVRTQVSNLKDNVVLVSSGSDASLPDAVQRYNPYGISATTSLAEQDLNIIRLTAGVKQLAPIMLLNGSISAGSTTNRAVPIVATTPDLADILGLAIKPGEFVNSTTSRDTTVIGAKLASELFGTTQVLGQQIMIKGRLHTVIGVLKQTDTPVNLSGIDLDHAVFVTFEDGKSFNQGIAQIQQLLITIADSSKLPAMQRTIEQTLLNTHNGEHNFTVLAGQRIAEHTNASFRVVVALTAIVATVTLVVGGIGIMNIMLVGVSERTREIGIRKALGATNQQVFSQFLIEALIMCIVGGVFGLASGFGLALVIGLQLAFSPAITWQIAITGLGMAFATGIIFGMYPAFKAARKDPIESLRQYH